jgi:anthranilate synthase component 1
MVKINLATNSFLADLYTPVGLYYRLRDIFPGSLLLESSDYHGNQNAKSFICCQPIAFIKVHNGKLSIKYPYQQSESFSIDSSTSIVNELRSFKSKLNDESLSSFDNIGLFGYMSFDSITYFEDISLQDSKIADIPDLYYSLYKYVIEIDHFHNMCRLHILYDENESIDELMTYFKSLMNDPRVDSFPFTLVGEEEANMTDGDFLNMINQGQFHCNRGDVFQVVLSRRYMQRFKGDDFSLYRALRSINPSPYLFYFDFGSFRLLGSSPEAQIKIEAGEATIFPIAGTFRRTGNDQDDARLAVELSSDPKENAEHIMLVDLARNDLSKVCDTIEVKVFKEAQFYSHVIHLVSEVKGILRNDQDELDLFTQTFPAGTLSGAPKHRAIQIIDEQEPHRRGFYGGALGYIGLNGDINHAIMIRTFLSTGNKLHYQAGAGVVFKSDPAAELQEVHNKLGALRKALNMAAQNH